MIFIGDVHGKFREYTGLLKLYKDQPSIQVGDFGIGFGFGVSGEPMPIPNHWFIRGNHDNPEKCRERSDYLGEFGYREDLGIFFVSGAFSIDRYLRTEGVDWWPDEELDYRQSLEAITLYEKIKPEIVVTHDCPNSCGTFVKPAHKVLIPSATGEMLEQMYQIYAPKIWIFGHYHVPFSKIIDKTTFIGLAELEVVVI
jgi:hypothetical protein